ncbi:MAG: hypothetical protein K0R76_1371 [Alphaproteobacteria bacterium]|jgi:hypothetical protein|nr:hypothetical protein [Alphaproteobacteria bacterium]
MSSSKKIFGQYLKLIKSFLNGILHALRVQQAVHVDSFVEGKGGKAREVAEELIVEGMVLEKISKVTKLNLEDVKFSAGEVAVRYKE